LKKNNDTDNLKLENLRTEFKKLGFRLENGTKDNNYILVKNNISASDFDIRNHENLNLKELEIMLMLKQDEKKMYEKESIEMKKKYRVNIEFWGELELTDDYQKNAIFYNVESQEQLQYIFSQIDNRNSFEMVVTFNGNSTKSTATISGRWEQE
jgi:hypothetical protein